MEAPAEVMEAPAEKANTAKERKRKRKRTNEQMKKKGERGKGFPSLAPRWRGQLELAPEFTSWPLR